VRTGPRGDEARGARVPRGAHYRRSNAHRKSRTSYKCVRPAPMVRAARTVLVHEAVAI